MGIVSYRQQHAKLQSLFVTPSSLQCTFYAQRGKTFNDIRFQIKFLVTVALSPEHLTAVWQKCVIIVPSPVCKQNANRLLVNNTTRPQMLKYDHL